MQHSVSEEQLNTSRKIGARLGGCGIGIGKVYGGCVIVDDDEVKKKIDE